jgi:hypothetical protein
LTDIDADLSQSDAQEFSSRPYEGRSLLDVFEFRLFPDEDEPSRRRTFALDHLRWLAITLATAK